MKGATCWQLQGYSDEDFISIHAPVKGATGDPAGNQRAQSDISIHAPVKGATVFSIIMGNFVLISIHAPVKGATWKAYATPHANIEFQSTHP